MKNHPHLPSADWLALARYFYDTASQAPKTGNYAPDFDGTKYDLDDVYLYARKEATGSRAEVSQLVAHRKSQGAWPRGQYRAKFWLKARLEEAGAYAKHLAEAELSQAIQPTSDHTTDVQRAKGWLLWDGWDEYLVDLWLAENMPFYARFDHSEGLPESFVDYSNWLERIRAGHYVKK
jgi:hypothetical protein